MDFVAYNNLKLNNLKNSICHKYVLGLLLKLDLYQFPKAIEKKVDSSNFKLNSYTPVILKYLKLTP